MDAKTARIVAGVALMGTGVVAVRSLGPKLHERCRSACAGKCGSGEVEEQSVQCMCSPQTASRAVEQHDEEIAAAGASIA